MAGVYRAFDKRLHRRVALKILGKRDTDSLQAIRLYFKGRYSWNKRYGRLSGDLG
jgi:hypothetical protein